MHKRHFCKTVSFIGIIMISIGLIVYSIDPYQQFRINKYYIKGKSRQSYPGIIKNFNYNSIIMGTSTSQNMLRKDVKKIFNLDAINVSLAGATSYEQRKMLELILETNNANTIIYGLDFFSYNRNLMEVREEVPKFIYSKNIFYKLEYIFNFDTIKEIIYSLKNTKNKDWIDNMGYWGDQFTYSKENTLTFDPKVQWGAQNMGALKLFKDGYSYNKMRDNFDSFLNIVKKYPNVNFKIYFPPYASLWWYFADKYNNVDDILNFKIYILESTKKYPNIKVYEFQDNSNITSDLNNYKDMVHYSPEISKWILEMMKKEKGLVESKNYYITIRNIRDQIELSRIHFKNNRTLNSY